MPHHASTGTTLPPQSPEMPEEDKAVVDTEGQAMHTELPAGTIGAPVVVTAASTDCTQVPRGASLIERPFQTSMWMHGLRNQETNCWLNSSLQSLKHLLKHGQ